MARTRLQIYGYIGSGGIQRLEAFFGGQGLAVAIANGNVELGKEELGTKIRLVSIRTAYWYARSSMMQHSLEWGL
jgi:hypothetical protein